MPKPKKDLKVLHILRPGIGGSAKHIELLVRHWSNPNIKIFVISSPLENPDFPKVLQLHAERVWEVPITRSLNPLKDLVAFCQILKILNKERFDVVHTHASKAGFLGRFAAFVAGVRKIIYTPHGFYFHYNINPWKKRFYFLVEYLLAGITSTIVCLTPTEAKQAKALCASKRIHIIPNALDIESFQKSALEKQEALPSDLKPHLIWILMVARLTPPKDPFTPIEALPLLLQEYPEVRLVFVGEGELKAECEQKVRQKKLEPFVFFLGTRQDIAHLLKQSKVSILSSFWEGLPYILLESFALSTPVVANKIPGHLQFIEDGKNGFLFETGSVEEFAFQIKKIISNEGLRKAIGLEGLKLVTSQFNIDIWLEKFYLLYFSK